MRLIPPTPGWKLLICWRYPAPALGTKLIGCKPLWIPDKISSTEPDDDESMEHAETDGRNNE
jgi:hypothetical protein